MDEMMSQNNDEKRKEVLFMKYEITESIKRFIEENNLTDFEGIFLSLNLKNIKEYVYKDLFKKQDIAPGDRKEIQDRLTLIDDFLKGIKRESVKDWYKKH